VGGWRGFKLVRGHGSSCTLEALQCCDVKGSYRSMLCSTRAGVALSSGRERDDDGKGTKSMRVSPTLLLTETNAGRKTSGDCTVSRCRFPISFHRSLS